MRRQGIYKSGPGMVGQARRQIANMQGPTQSIVNGTIFLPNETAQVFESGDYFVASPKFAHRYYQVVRTENGWMTSSNESRFQAYLINAVEQYIAAQLPEAA